MGFKPSIQPHAQAVRYPDCEDKEAEGRVRTGEPRAVAFYGKILSLELWQLRVERDNYSY